MKAKKGYRNHKSEYGWKNWFKRYFKKRTCRKLDKEIDKAIKDWVGSMRDTTPEEQEAINKYVRSKYKKNPTSRSTGANAPTGEGLNENKVGH